MPLISLLLCISHLASNVRCSRLSGWPCPASRVSSPVLYNTVHRRCQCLCLFSANDSHPTSLALRCCALLCCALLSPASPVADRIDKIHQRKKISSFSGSPLTGTRQPRPSEERSRSPVRVSSLLLSSPLPTQPSPALGRLGAMYLQEESSQERPRLFRNPIFSRRRPRAIATPCQSACAPLETGERWKGASRAQWLSLVHSFAIYNLHLRLRQG